MLVRIMDRHEGYQKPECLEEVTGVTSIHVQKGRKGVTFEMKAPLPDHTGWRTFSAGNGSPGLTSMTHIEIELEDSDG